jgi:pilus assembly protein Flp/PilA
MTSLVARFLKDESGATAIEYGLIAAGISIAIIVTVNQLGTSLNNVLDLVRAQHDSAPGATGAASGSGG